MALFGLRHHSIIMIWDGPALFGLWHHSTIMMWDGPALFGLWHHNDIMWDGPLCSAITVWSRSETALFDLWSNVNWSTLLYTWNTGLIMALSNPWNDILVISRSWLTWERDSCTAVWKVTWLLTYEDIGHASFLKQNERFARDLSLPGSAPENK